MPVCVGARLGALVGLRDGAVEMSCQSLGHGQDLLDVHGPVGPVLLPLVEKILREEAGIDGDGGNGGKRRGVAGVALGSTWYYKVFNVVLFMASLAMACLGMYGSGKSIQQTFQNGGAATSFGCTAPV